MQYSVEDAVKAELTIPMHCVVEVPIRYEDPSSVRVQYVRESKDMISITKLAISVYAVFLHNIA